MAWRCYFVYGPLQEITDRHEAIIIILITATVLLKYWKDAASCDPPTKEGCAGLGEQKDTGEEEEE